MPLILLVPLSNSRGMRLLKGDECSNETVGDTGGLVGELDADTGTDADEFLDFILFVILLQEELALLEVRGALGGRP